jgi:hypothetical protein
MIKNINEKILKMKTQKSENETLNFKRKIHFQYNFNN